MNKKTVAAMSVILLFAVLSGIFFSFHNSKTVAVVSRAPSVASHASSAVPDPAARVGVGTSTASGSSCVPSISQASSGSPSSSASLASSSKAKVSLSSAAANSAPPKPVPPPPPPASFHGAEFDGSTQVITVTAASMSTRYATVNVYQKNGEVWNRVISGISALIGKNGMVYDSLRQQDTDTTPAGIYKIQFAFGWADNPGTRLEYRVADDNSYWDENSGTSTYNRWVQGNPGGDYEQLKTQPLYQYAMALDFNWNQVARKGAGIFFHLKPQHYTGGCVGIDEGPLLQIMRWADPAQNIRVLICPQYDLSKYYF